jgi:hypothetical protein
VFADFAEALSATREPVAEEVAGTKRAASRLTDPGLAAAMYVVKDLANQGWAISADQAGAVAVTAPEAEVEPAAEKARVRRQELLKRDEQLSSPSVRRFIAQMEKPREFRGNFVSIFNLMRDGKSLAASLRAVAAEAGVEPLILRTVVDPYVQVVNNGDRCPHTGLRLVDIWRYFRHTWTNQYTSTPGRTMMIILRDRAADFHPVIGIAALGSPIVQIRERDEWIGWQPEEFLARLAAAPTLVMARWIVARLEQGREELYLDDLLEDGLYWPSLWESPNRASIERLENEALVRRKDHHRFARSSEFKARASEGSWQDRAKSDLFRSKRCLALADMLRARMALAPFLYARPTRRGLGRALDNAAGRRAIAGVLRRAKAEAIGTEMADLIVCGAIAPYNSLLGGKLVSMLAVSPTVVRAYHARYQSYSSEIASSLAGRSISRRSHLVFVGTTSLYGSGSSQYNRVSIPRHVLGGHTGIVFHQLGKSRSFGTSHLSNDTVTALVRLAEQSHNGARVNSIFGEGVNPKLRKVRAGLDLLGWPSNDLLQHHRPRIVYGVSLVDNLLQYLLGVDRQPRYAFRPQIRDDVERITGWWYERWLSKRVQSEEVLRTVAEHSAARPVRHGARVPMPRVFEREDENGYGRPART